MTEINTTVPKGDIQGSIRRALADIQINRKVTIYIVCVIALLFAIMAAPAMAQETICWNDTFDDESKIAGKNNVTVENGDVEIDLFNLSVSEWWQSDSLQVAGLGDIGYWSAPEMAFNITGDGKWNLFAGAWGSGYYWDGSQWVDDPSLVSGLLRSSKSTPAIAFNITGDGRWNLIEGGGVFYGYYWNGTQWISDSSLVTGLVAGSASDPSIAFNITGDGRWNLIAGYWGGGIHGHYWNGSQWISDSSLVAGLVGIGEAPAPTMAFNITGDGKWNLIAGNNDGEFFGYYWNGTQWVNSPPLASGLVGSYRSRPSVAFKDGGWCLVGGNSAGTFYGFVHGARTSITSEVISLPADDHWLFFFANDTLSDCTHITYKILDEWNNTLMNVVPGQVITDVTDAKVRLSAELITDNLSQTPVLHDWGICCVEGLPGGVLKEKKRLTFDPNSSTCPSVATDSEGNVHVVWAEDRSGWQIHFMKLAANGTVMINEKVLPASGGDPTILIDPDDNLHVTFNDQPTASLPDAYYMKLDNVGEVLIAPKKILSGHEPLATYRPWQRAFTIDSTGDIHAVEMYAFDEQCGNGNCYYDTIHYIKFDNEGRELLNTTLVTFCIKPPAGWRAEPCDAVSIATDSDGIAHVVYNRGTPEYDVFANKAKRLDIYYFKVDSSGAVLKDTRLTTDLNESRYPVVCADATGNAHIIWCDNRAGWDIYYTKLDSSGDVLIDNKQTTFESSADSFGVSSIDIESGVMHVTFSQKSKIYYMALDTNGIEIVDRTLLIPPGHETSASNPSMDAVSDGSHLVWNEKREHDPASEIYYARLVLPPDRVFLTSPPDKWTPVDVNATYSIGILSTMANTGTFNLTLDNLDGADAAELSNSTITLDPLIIGEVILNVTDADVGDYRATVRVTSQTNPEITASATITTSVIVPKPDLIVTAIDAYHNGTGYSPYFNIPNEVDVEVENTGTGAAGAFNVNLYADGEFVDKQTIPDLGYGSSTTAQFKWTPIGLDCEDGGSSQEYTLKAIADCDYDMVESDEANNELTTQETVYWAGYSADEHINAIAWHGMLHGGLHYTTGDGAYTGLYIPGNSEDTHYSITLPAGASIELARLNVYYTWSKVGTTGVYPVMEVRITNTTGTYLVASAAEYNDRPCVSPAIGYEYPFGNYAYDLTPYITGDGSYTVNVKNVGPTDYSFCIAAPGIVILYEDDTKPEYEFWILEGADLLEGGRRSGAGNLDLSECISNATFTGDIDTDKVDNATLGIVSAWGGVAWGEDLTSYYWFNDHYLGDGSMLGGYGSLYDKTVNCISMYAGASGNAQVGVNVSDVISYIASDNNTISFGDDGDSMLAANAFFVVERGAGRPPAPLLIYGGVNYTDDGGPANDSDVVITNLNTSEVLAVETATDSNYYQAVTSSHNVSVGDLLNFNASNGDSTELNHTVTSEEMGDGCFVQNLTVGRPGICGDVNDDRDVDMTDVMTVWYDFADYPYPGAYTISNAWAADVNCDGYIDMTDVMTIWYDFADYPYVGAYEVNCCE